MKHLFYRIQILLILIACACTYSLPAFAWGQEGHRIIAKIAYDNLTKRARKQVDNILGDRGMIYWANWADEIKSDTIYPEMSSGHFQDLDAGLRKKIKRVIMQSKDRDHFKR